MTEHGRLIGVGTGPGDPELLTLKAVRAIEGADVIAYFAKEGRGGNGKAIVEPLLKSGVTLLPLYYPVTTEIDKNDERYQSLITQFYDRSAAAIAGHLDARRTSPCSAKATRCSTAPICTCMSDFPSATQRK